MGCLPISVGKPVLDCKVWYGVGQGMGLYSRWAIMALLHHALVRLRAIRVGLKDFGDYLILGDDIVIARKEVSESYVTLMNRIGVEISLRKSVPRRTSTGAEFASKLICDQGDLSPLPLGCVIAGTIARLFQL